jgi:MSHA biogenesis protein MshN
MSLINKMLQDLDARGGGAASAVQQDEVKAVPAMERDRRPLLLGGAAAGVLVVAAGAWYGWQYWQAHKRRLRRCRAARVIDNRIPNQPRFQEPPATASAATRRHLAPLPSRVALPSARPRRNAPCRSRPPKPAEHVRPKRVARRRHACNGAAAQGARAAALRRPPAMASCCVN